MKKDKETNRKEFWQGFRDGIPIGLGYFAVAFSLGIIAKKAGLDFFQGFVASATSVASAGEYVGFTMMLEKASYISFAIAIFITNARYILMSCALSQHISEDTGLGHRLGIAFGVTDEIFGISIARKGYLNPRYNYGAILASVPLWAIGTSLGIIAGNILPGRIVSALSVALYGMFLAIIIPPAKKNKIVGCLVVVSFVLSYLFGIIPKIKEISGGNRTIILTVLIAGIAALLFPVKEEEDKEVAADES